MTNLEQEIRELLEEEVRSAPTPHEAAGVLRTTRRRQGMVLAVGALTVAALAAASVLGLRALLPAGRGTPADQPNTTTTINGISITYPAAWSVIDPDEAGLNGPEPTPDLPRLILAVAPFDPGEAFGCPGLAGGTPHTFLMTVQEEPLSLTGADAAAWPVELEPLGADASESGCYPGWEFLRAGWTAAGRTFEARMGLAPEVSHADREALFGAFSSMTFEPSGEGTSSVVLATGTAGGEEWELIGRRQADGLSLTLQGESFGTGTGGFDPTPDELEVQSHVFGSGEGPELVVFGAVPEGIVRVEAFTAFGGPVIKTDVLDVPDEIDPQLNAFVLIVLADPPVFLNAYNADGRVVLRGTGPPGAEPVNPPLPEPDEVLFKGRTADCFWTLTRTTEATGAERLQLASSEGDLLLVELVADVGPGAPPLQIASFECQGGVLVFGIATDDVADIRWTDPIGGDGGPPGCLAADLPSGFCFFLDDFSGAGEAIALDAAGNELARAPYG